MNRLIWTAALILGVSAGAAAEDKVKTKTPAQAVAALVSFVAPKGWRVVDYANAGGADVRQPLDQGGSWPGHEHAALRRRKPGAGDSLDLR